MLLAYIIVATISLVAGTLIAGIWVNTWKDSLTIGGCAAGMSIVLCFFIGMGSTIRPMIFVNDYEWEPIYGKANYIMMADGIRLIRDKDGEHYMFTVINNSDKPEMVYVNKESIELIEICGAKPAFLPITYCICKNPPLLTKWFHGTLRLNVTPMSAGKLVVCEDTYIEEYEYQRVKLN